MKKLIGFLTVAGAALLVSSCCNCGKTGSRAKSLTGGQWQLIQMDGEVFSAENDAYTLSFSTDGKVTGKGDCNRLSGTFESDPQKRTILLGAMVSTRMMCLNQAGEDKFLDLLRTANSYSVDRRTLTLFSDGKQKLIFEKRKP